MLLTAYSRLVGLAHYYSVVAALDYYYCLPLCGLESMVAVTFTIGNQLGVEIPMPFPNSSVPGWLATSPKGKEGKNSSRNKRCVVYPPLFRNVILTLELCCFCQSHSCNFFSSCNLVMQPQSSKFTPPAVLLLDPP